VCGSRGVGNRDASMRPHGVRLTIKLIDARCLYLAWRPSSSKTATADFAAIRQAGVTLLMAWAGVDHIVAPPRASVLSICTYSRPVQGCMTLESFCRTHGIIYPQMGHAISTYVANLQPNLSVFRPQFCVPAWDGFLPTCPARFAGQFCSSNAETGITSAKQ
jgi:hypothetical protein